MTIIINAHIKRTSDSTVTVSYDKSAERDSAFSKGLDYVQDLFGKTVPLKITYFQKSFIFNEIQYAEHFSVSEEPCFETDGLYCNYKEKYNEEREKYQSLSRRYSEVLDCAADNSTAIINFMEEFDVLYTALKPNIKPISVWDYVANEVFDEEKKGKDQCQQPSKTQ